MFYVKKEKKFQKKKNWSSWRKVKRSSERWGVLKRILQLLDKRLDFGKIVIGVGFLVGRTESTPSGYRCTATKGIKISPLCDEADVSCESIKISRYARFLIKKKKKKTRFKFRDILIFACIVFLFSLFFNAYLAFGRFWNSQTISLAFFARLLERDFERDFNFKIKYITKHWEKKS